jgi:hypothetical protein
LGLSAAIVAILGVLAYIIPNIGLIMDIAGGVFGIPMIFLFPAYAAIKKKLFKSMVGNAFLWVWFVFWALFVIFTIIMIIMDQVKGK